jgi:hypothetical protein
MLIRRFLSALLVLALASIACSVNVSTDDPTPVPTAATTAAPLPGEATPSPVPATETPPTPAPPAADLTLEQLRNAEVEISATDDHRMVQLADGRFEQGSDPAAGDYVSVSMGQQVAFGDLNNDGAQDAAIILGENYGGTGSFVSVVAMLNQGGQPVFAAAALIDDRPMVNALDIQNGEILVDAVIHGPNDPGCCPAQAVKQSYRLWDLRLVLSRFTSTTPLGQERIITIDAPANGAEVSGPFNVTGSFTISPFESNLAYAVFLEGTPDPIVQAGMLVNAPELGGPGTFQLPLDFTSAGIKGNLRIEISDLSAADGSYLALASVFVTIK